ncbi:AMP-binding protein [Methylomonas methanica]|uniref:AMP-dependent synthetase and ligase n=1 Tax=Methylomonas methanica (strain DSM 25384 / MC09) TaxID=857087 RepID=G0A1A4_METMM|nr:AMP-binding protein [Methylomonas methanica]AEG02524.1 AMP-dependent synthetase and ligase [Methylomonas methanica MC09]
MQQALPLQKCSDSSVSYNEEPFAVFAGRVISRKNLWADVQRLAASLPDRAYMINLCENRYLFCIALLAAASRGQICLLPPSGQAAVIREIVADYPNAYLAGDGDPQLPGISWFEVGAPDSAAQAGRPVEIDWSASRLIAFSSGSSGKPQANMHTLETMRISASMAVGALGLQDQIRVMVSTTPPQHMYGLETSVFWPLFSRLVLYDRRPFFPEDIRCAVAGSAWPAVLVTTPTHLRHLGGGDWSNLSAVISATDTLSDQLARESADRLGLAPVEIYGSTETLSFAHRQILSDNAWQLYPGCQLSRNAQGQTYLRATHLPTDVVLPDRINLQAGNRFAVLGRQGDMVKIGGKRSSLSELNRRLLDIQGVEDGFFYLHHDQAGEDRLAAVVVSRLDKQQIRTGLQPYLDQVFLPRKIHYVDTIPRNSAGKLTKTEREALMAKLI